MSTPLRTLPSIALLFGLFVLCFAVAAVGGLSTAQGVADWYPALDKPPWTPPNAAFGPVWTVLYTLMAVAGWDVLRRRDRPAPAMAWFGAQLALNALWSPLFFAWQRTGLALLVITALWAAIAGTIAVFWSRSRLAAGLLVPYLVWVSIAWSLNAWIWWFDTT
ncbi:MAG: tryptophan-rich sensory protein [Myxococcales bacterium]|nr:tryptophan-rich sensory protein [Myxococcales bacterium]